MAGHLSKVDITKKFPKYYKPLSRRLYEVLEDIGATTEIRDLMVKYRTSEEIRDTMYMQLAAETRNIRACSSNSRVTEDLFSVYTCGSSFEGTTTHGMRSDIDTLIVADILPVVTDISDAQLHDRCLLMVQDFYTPPGYVKLQWVSHGVPRFLSSVDHIFLSTDRDREYRSVSIDNRDIEDGIVIHGPARSRPVTFCDYDGECRTVYIDNINIVDGQVINGPARSRPATETKFALDFVHAVRCRKIPDCASEWFTRHRRYNWPTAEWIDKCKTLGCFFVYVGHPNSEEKHLQWRMSFSLQERFLVTQFNSVQLKCYIVMKMIKNDIVYKDVGEKSLTSYHCKTCLLYLIENTPAEFWREDNLLVCLYTYLSQILRCVETMNCPNYFLPDENMFNGRLHGEIQIKLRNVLRNILASNFHFLLKLNTDDLGMQFRVAVLSGVHYGRFLTVVDYRKKFLFADNVCSLLYFRNSILCEFQRSHSEPAVTCKMFNRLKLRLQNTNRVTEHTQEQTKNAFSLVLPYIDISHMSVMAVLAKPLHKSNAFILRILTSEKWHQISLKSDQFSSKLKQASLLYMMEFPDVSLDVLLHLEGTLQHQLSVCHCSDDHAPLFKLSEELMHLEGNTPEELFNKCFIPCVVYLPAEQDLTPSAICYEMNRSLGFPDDDREDWYDLATVDGKILLYFLLYLNHRHLGMEAHAAADVENIRWLIETDEFLGHRETALNLLGWINKERGRVDIAVECFRKSLTLQPTHNAAFWHMRDIEKVLLVFLSSRFPVT